MKFAFLLFILLLASEYASTQQHLFDGYYINSKGDTIKGVFPSFKQWNRNPVSAKFVSNKQNNEIVLTPDNCQSFSINGYDTYVAYKGTRLINPIDEVRTDVTDSASTYDSVNTFLRVIYQNNIVTIYYYNGDIRVNIFYQKSGSNIVELEKKLYANYVNNYKQIVSINNYKTQLASEFSPQVEKNKLQNKLNELNYSDKDISDFMDQLFATSSARKRKKYSPEMFIGIGLSFSSFSYKSTSQGNTNSLTEMKYSCPIKPLFQIGAKFYFQRNLGKIFISPLIKLYSQSSKGYTQTSTYYLEHSFETGTIINPMVNIGYDIISDKHIKFYAAAAMGATAFMDNKEKNILNMSQNYVSVRNNNMTKFIVGMNLGVEFKKRWDIWLNYIPPIINVAQDAGFNGIFSTFQMGTSWHFKLAK